MKLFGGIVSQVAAGKITLNAVFLRYDAAALARILSFSVRHNGRYGFLVQNDTH